MLSPNLKEYLRRLDEVARNKPDGVSVSAQVASHTIRLTGVSERFFFSDPDLFVNNHLLVSAYYDLDSPSMYYDMYNIEAEALGQALVWIPGMFPEIDGSNLLVKEEGDLDRLYPPDPKKDGRMPFVIEVYKRMVDLGLNPSPRYCAPFTLAGNIRGLSKLLIDILTNPSFAHQLFNFVTTDVLMPWIETLRRECGAGLFALGADAQASLPLTNLEIIEQYALDYVLKMRQEIGNIGVTAWWGERYLDNPEELFKLKLRGNPGVLKGYDPDVYKVGPEKFVEFAGANNAQVSLGVDSTVLASEPIPTVIDRVKSYVRAMRGVKKGNLFLNEVTRECLSDQVHAAVQAAKFYRIEQDADNPDARTFGFRPKEPFIDWVMRP